MSVNVDNYIFMEFISRRRFFPATETPGPISNMFDIFKKVCPHEFLLVIQKPRDFNFYNKITKTRVFLVKQARNYISINFVALCKRL